jgi:hypothetical protein
MRRSVGRTSPLGTDVSSTSSSDLHLVELSTNFNSMFKFTVSVFRLKVGWKNDEIPYIHNFLQIQSVWFNVIILQFWVEMM